MSGLLILTGESDELRGGKEGGGTLHCICKTPGKMAATW